MAVVLLWLYLIWRPAQPSAAAGPVPHLNHVFVIVMENHSLDALKPSEAPYIRHLIEKSGYDSSYYGVTHVSLPNYAALLGGQTFGTHSDNPNQIFGGPTLVSQLDHHHISWEAVMQSLPYAGYSGSWYPEKPGTNPVLMPKNALYAKKHNPFLLFRSMTALDKNRVVPMTVLNSELKAGRVPRFVWITPNLCDDMHGQPKGSDACPYGHPRQLVQDGNRFLAELVPQITHSPAFTGHSVIFITWDESQMPSSIYSLSQWKEWLMAGPGSPRDFGVPIGGGSVPIIAVIPGPTQPPHIAEWADHFSLLKTIEAGFGLPYLGQARNSSVKPLSALVHPR